MKENDECNFPFCGESYDASRLGEIRIKCLMCSKQVHQLCIDCEHRFVRPKCELGQVFFLNLLAPYKIEI